MSRTYRNKKNIFPSEENEKETIRKLKAELRHTKKENKRLKSELKTLNKAFDKTAEFLGFEIKDLAVEEVIELVNKGLNIK